jgi:hypothetical protein
MRTRIVTVLAGLAALAAIVVGPVAASTAVADDSRGNSPGNSVNVDNLRRGGPIANGRIM